MRVAQLLAAAGVFVGVHLSSPSYAENGLPPEARARILLLQIDDALKASPPNEKGALAKIAEFDALGVARPSYLYTREAQLSARAKDYARSKSALDRYFKAVGPQDPDYNRAVQMYAVLEKRDAEQKAVNEAVDSAAWSAAASGNSCGSYLNYLKTAKTGQKADEALSSMDRLRCSLPSTNEVASASSSAVLKSKKAREAADASVRGKQFEAAARSAKIEGRWGDAYAGAAACQVAFSRSLTVDGGKIIFLETNYPIQSVNGRVVSTVDPYGIVAEYKNLGGKLQLREIYPPKLAVSYRSGAREYVRQDGFHVVEVEFVECG